MSMEPKHVAFQVTDVHKALLSLSKCADAGIDSVFGRNGGYLYDTQSGETIPLYRKGNLYILRAWVKSAKVFGRQGA